MEQQIKKKLSSSRWEDRHDGLVLLDRTYREFISWHIHSWAVSLTSEDLADVWQETMLSLARRVMGGKFTNNGSLTAYLRTVANAKAIDMLRKRIRIDDSNIEAVEETCCPDCWLHILEEIKICYASLSEKLQLVLRKDVELFVRNFRWVSLEELTDEINKQLRIPLSRTTVKSRRDRARQQLRTKLKERENRD